MYLKFQKWLFLGIYAKFQGWWEKRVRNLEFGLEHCIALVTTGTRPASHAVMAAFHATTCHFKWCANADVDIRLQVKAL